MRDAGEDAGLDEAGNRIPDDPEDEGVEYLADVVGLSGAGAVTFAGAPARLRVRLRVFHDGQEWRSRLAYYAVVYLVRDGVAPDRRVGAIFAYRVTKRTRARPAVGRQWLRDFHDVGLEGGDAIGPWGQSLAWALQAVYGFTGEPRLEVADEFQGQLGNDGNDLLYIADLQITRTDPETGANVSRFSSPPLVSRLRWHQKRPLTHPPPPGLARAHN